MLPEPQNHFLGPLVPSVGFVVAMRAKLVFPHRPPQYEWMIVSRWGIRGENLSLGWTSLAAATGDAPINLTPRQTAFAVRHERCSAWTPATFRLARWLPDRVTVAGDFVPAEGYVRLYGSGSTLRVRSEGSCPVPDFRQAWDMEATRAIWIGEFIEGQFPTGR